MTLPTQYSEPWAASPDSPYDTPEPCPECGSADAEYLPHEPECPSGFPTREALQEAAREYEDEHPMAGPL